MFSSVLDFIISVVFTCPYPPRDLNIALAVGDIAAAVCIVIAAGNSFSCDITFS